MATADSTRRCPNCAQVLDGGERFCPVCGAVLAQETEETPEIPAPPADHTPRVPAPRTPADAYSPAADAEAALPEASPVAPQLRPGVVVSPPTMTPPTAAPQFLSGSRMADLLLGFLGVFVFNVGLPGAAQALVGDESLIPGGTFLVAISIVGYFLMRGRYPAFARGWGIGLIVMLVMALLALLAVVLLILGILAICSGTKR